MDIDPYLGILKKLGVDLDEISEIAAESTSMTDDNDLFPIPEKKPKIVSKIRDICIVIMLLGLLALIAKGYSIN